MFWAGVSGYVGLLAYLIVTPEGAQRVAAAVSRSASRWSMRRASSAASSYTSLPGAPGVEANGNNSIAALAAPGGSKSPDAEPESKAASTGRAPQGQAGQAQAEAPLGAE